RSMRTGADVAEHLGPRVASVSRASEAALAQLPRLPRLRVDAAVTDAVVLERAGALVELHALVLRGSAFRHDSSSFASLTPSSKRPRRRASETRLRAVLMLTLSSLAM